MSEIVSLKNVKKSYDGRTVLQIDSLLFDSGKICAVLGPNGSGKSTMLRILAGLEKQDSGAVSCPDYISYLMQEVYLFDMPVIKNMTMAIGKGQNSVRCAMEALERVDMTSFAAVKARCLSGGERQRVAIARTLVQKKELILLDEPAASVDAPSTMLVEKYIKETNKQVGSTVIFTTHNPSQAMRIADEAIIMSNGIPIERGAPAQIFNSPQQQETKQFLQNWRI